MAQGIIILGLNGCGKTTVGHELAAHLGLFRMDAEDYYFPVPNDYTASRTEEAVHLLMEEDIRRYGDFVLSCVRCNVSEAILRHIRLAVVLRTSPEVRAQRIIQRGMARFGERVLPGGDIFESQQAFHAFAAARSENLVTESLVRLDCPVMEIDAALPASQIAERIARVWLTKQSGQPSLQLM